MYKRQDHFSTDGLKTGYGEIDVFFGGGKAAHSEAGIYYNRLHQSNHGKDADKDYFAKYIAGYFARGNYGKWSLLANYEHIGFKDGVKNVDGQDYGDAWMGTLQYGKADFHQPGSWDTWLEYLDLDDGSFLGGNPFTWRFSSDMDNQRSWGIGVDYIVAKNLKFSVMQSFASNKAASDEGNNPYMDLAKVDYNFGSKNWELSVGRNDVYRIGRDAYGLQYFDALDGAELRYHNDKLAVTTGYGKFKDGKKPGVDTVKPISDAHSDHFSTDGLKTGYGEIDVFFGGGKAARSEAGVYYLSLIHI